MPIRKITFETSNYYHVYNRGFMKIPIFKTDRDCERFCSKIDFYSIKYGVNILSYALMDNHFHFLISQNTNGSIQNFMQKLQQSYATYFNIKYRRRGPLFEGRFQAKVIDTIDYFIDIQKYISNNPIKALKNVPEGTRIRSSLVKPGLHFERT